MKAIWNEVILAESEETVIVEGNHYFPPSSINNEYFKTSSTSTVCHWKGKANYYTLLANGKENKDAAWHYAAPSSEAEQIKDYVAFWKGVKIID